MPQSETATTDIQEELDSLSNGSEARAAETALNSIRRTISENPGFPAFSANVQELLGIEKNPYNTINTVSQIILRDLSLTTQILKLVNSIYFQSYQRQVHTISSAVMVLGFDRIRDLAIGLRLFENFKGSQSVTQLKQLIVVSFLTAIQAQELAGRNPRFKPEEIFLLALFYNIGELICAFYLPDKYKEIHMLVAVKGLSKRRAAQQVLKVSLEDLGLAVLQDWNIPEGIVQNLSNIYEAEDNPSDNEKTMRQLVSAAYSLARASMDPEIDQEVRRKKQEKVCRSLDLKLPAVAESMSASKKRLQEMAHVLHIDLRKVEIAEEVPSPDIRDQIPVKTRVEDDEIPWPPKKPADWTAPTPKNGIAPAPPPRSEAEEFRPSQNGAETDDFKRLQLISQVLDEVSQAVVSKAPIDQILMMILEGIFRGIGFERVIFSLVNLKRTHIVARFGLGAGSEELLPLLRATLQEKNHVFSLALAENKEYALNPETQPRDRPLMPEEFWRISKASSCLVSPIVVDQKPFGAIYADRGRCRQPISDMDRLRLRLFRDQLIIAIRLSSSHV